ncbi:MAG: hypothetical protein Q8876_06525 [Bacillota bacterium]|nr:hypothetical protein [Bacillota bacterium]
MQLIDIGTFLAVVGAAATALTMIIKASKACFKIRDSFCMMEKHQAETYMMCLKLIIMCEDMPMTERIEAGDKYISQGGNGAIKEKYKSLLEEYRREVSQ